MAYIQKNHPYPVTSCGRRRTFVQGGDPGDDRTKESPYNKNTHTMPDGTVMAGSEHNK